MNIAYIVKYFKGKVLGMSAETSHTLFSKTFVSQLKSSTIPRIWECDGYSAFFMNYDTRRVSGWASRQPKVGDKLRCSMQSGKVAEFEFTEVEGCLDPRDQYFATVKDLGYVK